MSGRSGRAGFGERLRKAEAGSRLPGGEDIGGVSREVRVAPPELERWRREFLEGGWQGLKARKRVGGELMRTRATLGRDDHAGRAPDGAAGRKGVEGTSFGSS